MVKILSLVILMLLPLLSHAESSLRIVTDRNQVEIGKSINISILAKNISDNLSSIDISSLKNNFGIEVVESATKLDGKNSIQELKLNLYPRQTGLLTIPELNFGEYKTLPTRLTVNDAGALQFEALYDTDTAWQRQQIILNTAVITPSKFARLEFDDFSQTGVEAYKLKSNQIKLPDGRFKLSASWKLFPLLSGQQSFYAPSVNYRLSGKIQRRFYPPVKNLIIKTLPSYIPPLMPVGKLNVNSHVSSNNIWTLEFSGSDISPSSLSSLSVPTVSITDIKFGDITTSRELYKSISHDIPLLFKESQITEIPGLVFRSFDPTTGKIVTQQTEKLTIIFISTWLKIVLLLSATLIIYKLISAALAYVRKIISRKQKERAVINSILKAKSPQELHLILNKYAAIKNWGSNLSLSQWGAIWSRNQNKSAEKLINELSLACYAKNNSGVPQTILNKKIYDLICS